MATTAPIPGSENMTYPHETSIHRVYTYPVVKDTVAVFYNIAHKNSYVGSTYDHIEALSVTLANRLAPALQRVPLERIDDITKSYLDALEKRFPVVKSETNELFQSLRTPADNAVNYAKTRVYSPVSDQITNSVSAAQEALGGLQERLKSIVASVPRDKASATDLYGAFVKELETHLSSVRIHAKELPATAQSAVKPVTDSLGESLTHIRDELTKPDVPIATKASTVLAYTQERVGPLLNSLKEVVTTKKAEVEEEVAPKVNGSI